MGSRQFDRCLALLVVLLLLCRDAAAGPTWCVAKPDANDADLQKGLNYACGEGGADCTAIQQGGSCFEPSTIHDHASYAYNSYYQDIIDVPAKWHGAKCDFSGTAMITSTDPSTGTCKYPCKKHHFILLIIHPNKGRVQVMDSLRRDLNNWQDLQQCLQKAWKWFTAKARGECAPELTFEHLNCPRQPPGTNLCGYYIYEFIRQSTHETGERYLEQLRIERMQDHLLPKERVRAIQEEICGFLDEEVLKLEGE